MPHPAAPAGRLVSDRARRNRLIGWMAFAAFLLLAATLVVSTLGMGESRCEVTMVFDGREDTRTARGATEPDAIRAAITGACARIAHGRTQNILCLDTPPRAVRCE